MLCMPPTHDTCKFRKRVAQCSWSLHHDININNWLHQKINKSYKLSENYFKKITQKYRYLDILDLSTWSSNKIIGGKVCPIMCPTTEYCASGNWNQAPKKLMSWGEKIYLLIIIFCWNRKSKDLQKLEIIARPHTYRC